MNNPVNGKAFLPGQLIVFQGTATDLEDGGLPDASLRWSSDRLGALGAGPSLPVNTLPSGWNTVTLSASDSAGHTTSAVVRVFVGHRDYLPRATLC